MSRRKKKPGQKHFGCQHPPDRQVWINHEWRCVDCGFKRLPPQPEFKQQETPDDDDRHDDPAA